MKILESHSEAWPHARRNSVKANVVQVNLRVFGYQDVDGVDGDKFCVEIVGGKREVFPFVAESHETGLMVISLAVVAALGDLQRNFPAALGVERNGRGIS